MHKILFYISLFHASTCFEHHVVIVRRSKIVLYSLWYHHTYRWPCRAQVERGLSTYACSSLIPYSRLFTNLFPLSSSYLPPIVCNIPLVHMNHTFAHCNTDLNRIHIPCGYFVIINRPLIAGWVAQSL